jgi:hypothetical protein
MRKILIFIFLLLVVLSPALGSIVAITGNGGMTPLNLTENSNSIAQQFITIIPKEALINTGSITGIRFYCTKGATYPNQNLIIRVYKSYGLGVFELLDNTYITPSQCEDFMYPITWTLFDVIPVDHSYDYALGMYSNSVTVGGWTQGYINNTNIIDNNLTAYSYAWRNVTTVLPIINVSVLNVIGTGFIPVPYYDEIRNIDGLTIYGIFELPPTPTPTATPLPTSTIAPDTTPLTDGTNPGNLSDPNATKPITYKPGDNQAINNNTVNGSFGDFATGMGYSSNIGGYISMAQDYMMIYVFLGMLIYIIMLYSKERN